MKKQVLTLFAALTVSAAFSQSIPNGGFENWTSTTFENPMYFYTPNGQMLPGGGSTVNVLKTTDAYNGSFAVQLNTVLVGSDTAIAYVANGNPGQPAGQGIPYNQKPNSLRFHYKCNLLPGDTAVVMVFFKFGGSVISQDVKKITGTQNTYALSTLTLNIPVTPDSLIFAAASTNFFSSTKNKPGSMLQIDSLFFTGVSSQPVNFNGNFEQWQPQTIDNLNGWEISSQSSGISNKTTDKYSGTYAFELRTNNNNGVAQPETATSGHSVQGGTVGGYPYALQNDSLFFYYKYSFGDPADSARVNLGFKAGGVTFATQAILLAASATYKKMGVKINLLSAPDSLIVYIAPSKTFSTPPLSYVGADLKIDQMSFKSQLIPVTSFSMVAPGCTNYPIQFTDMSSNIPTSWTWSFSNGTPLTSNAQNPVVSFVSPGTHTVILTTSNSYGTGNTITQVITINQSPFVNPTSTSNTICPGGSPAQLDANNSLGSTVTWMPGNVGGSPIFVSPSVTTTYTVIAIAGNGCSSDNGTNNQTIIVTVLPSPTVTVNSPTVCAGTTTTLTANGAVTYAWVSGPNTQSMAVFNPQTTAVYTVTGTDANSCSSTVSSTVTVNPLPVPAPTSNSPICVNQTINLFSASVGVTYSWSGPLAYASSAQNPSILNASIGMAGTYNVQATDVNGCVGTDTVSIVVNGCAGLNKNTDNLVTISPNPSSGVFTINLPDANATAGIFDLTGKKVASFNLNNLKSQIDLSSFTDGVYFIEISSSQGIFRKKIMKAN